MRKIYVKITLIITFTSFCFYVGAQEMKVTDFHLCENTISANIQGPNRRIDQNGEVAALIKVRTIETGFVFEGGLLGIVDAKQDVGEIYVWVPRGAKQITLKHARLGVLNYWYPRQVPIESGRTYEMTLETTLPLRVETEYLIMQVTPFGADIYIDDTLQMTTRGRLIKRLTVGAHKYEIRCVDYVTQIDTFDVYNDRPTELNIALSPRKGEELITSNVPGTRIYVNGIFHAVTPCRYQGIEGKYSIRAAANGYKDKIKSVSIYGGDSTGVTRFRLTPGYVQKNKWMWNMVNYSVYMPTGVSELGTYLLPI